MLVDNVYSLIESSEESVPAASAAKLAAKLPPLEVASNEVHVWVANLSDYDPNSLLPLLASDEAERALRFHFERDRKHFINARGLLRQLLAAYLKTDPTCLTFGLNTYGKPYLNEGQSERLNFNVAHSGGMAAYAFVYGRDVGIDIEQIRDDVQEVELSERFFSARECADLKALSRENRREAFFNCWTRKEAYIKARGEGLSLALDRFSVSFIPGHEPALLTDAAGATETSRWSMKSINVPPGYVGAIVAEGHDWQLQEFVL